MTEALYFGAEFCGPCKTFKPRFIKACEAKKIPYEIYDAEENELAFGQYGIRNVPTIIFLDGEKVIKRGPAADLILDLEYIPNDEFDYGHNITHDSDEPTI